MNCVLFWKLVACYLILLFWTWSYVKRKKNRFLGKIKFTSEMFLAVGLWYCCIRCRQYVFVDFHFHFNQFFISHNFTSRTIKLSRWLLSSRTTCALFFKPERFHGSALAAKLNTCRYCFFFVLKYTDLIFLIIPRNVSVELRYTLLCIVITIRYMKY